MDILKRLQVMETEYLRIESQAKQQLETVREAMKIVKKDRRMERLNEESGRGGGICQVN